MSSSLTQQLLGCCDRSVGADIRQRAARHLLDWLGCALIGSTSPAGRAFAIFGYTYPTATGPCLNISGKPCGATEAAFLNGGLGNIYEMDDVHRASILHVGDVVMPAALSVAQETGAAPIDLLDAIVGGYEITLRIGIAASANGYSSWYNSGTCGVFGAAYAAGKLYGLTDDQLADALGQAGMLASGIWQCRLEPTFSKQLATSHAAQSGVIAARLGATGFPGAKKILEGELGFFKSYYPASDPSAVLQEADGEWLIREVSFKPWPACRHAHPAIEAARAAATEIGPEQIASVTVDTYTAALDFCDNADPQSDHEARFSLQHCVAVSLLRGEPQLRDSEQEARDDRAISALRKRIHLREDSDLSNAFPAMMGSRISVELADGTMIERAVETAKGDPENPMTCDELDAKFLRLAAASGIDENDAVAAMTAILNLPDTPDLDQLNTSLAKITAALTPRNSS